MKISFYENEESVYINIKPESFEEANKLARLAQNKKQVPVEIAYIFSGNEPSLDVVIKKIKIHSQHNLIRK